MDIKLIKEGKQCVGIGYFNNPCRNFGNSGNELVTELEINIFNIRLTGYIFTAVYEDLVLQEINKQLWNCGTRFMAIFDTSDPKQIKLLKILYS